MNWFIKTASLLTLTAVMSVSCERETVDEGTGVGVKVPDLAVAFNKNVIRNNGETATLKAYYKGEDVTDEAYFFQFLPGKDVPQQMTTNVFSSTEVGEYHFQAAYLTSTSAMVSVNVVDREIPEPLKDESAGNTSFVHRTFLNQHTGAGCGYCPGMTKLLKETLVGDVEDMAVLAALRTYGGGEAGFAAVPNPSNGYPFLHIDYDDSYDFSKGTAEGLAQKIKDRVSDPASVGISAHPVYYADSKQIIVRVTVKAAVKGEYNVGLWLMQDNWYKIQSDYLGIITGGVKDPYHYHDNCVRIADSNYLGAHVGYPLGVLESGKTSDWVFVFDLKDAIENSKNKGGWWESFTEQCLDDLHFAAFVTTHEGSTYSVVNAIDFKYNEERPFEYIK